LWRWLGYVCTGSVQEEAFLFLHGQPGSGKTSLVEALHDILGDADEGGYATKIKIELLLQSKVDNSDRLAHCAGARFVHCAETEQNRTWREALVSEFTGGDRMGGKFLYHESFTFKPTHKLLIHGNFRPHIKGAGGGISRRLHLIEYPGKIEHIDRTFKQRLREEYPAILHSMITAAREWADVGLGLPESVERNVTDYIESEDTLAAWLEQNCERSDPEAKTRSSALYEDYKGFLQAHGEFVPSNKAFSQQLTARGFTIEKSSYRQVRGIALRNPPGQPRIPYSD